MKRNSPVHWILLLLAMSLSGCAEPEQISSYDLPKSWAEDDARQQLLQFSAPQNWSRSYHDRLSQFAWEISDDSGARARVTVTWLPPQGADIPSNIARWQKQLDRDPSEKPELTEIAIGSSTGTLLDIASNENPSVVVVAKLLPGETDLSHVPSGKVAMLGAILPGDENSWAFKLSGDANLVHNQKDAFLQFLKSLKEPTHEVARGD